MMNKTVPDLLPCPFCGLDDIFTYRKIDKCGVVCSVCKVEVVSKQSFQAVVDVWNTRDGQLIIEGQFNEAKGSVH